MSDDFDARDYERYQTQVMKYLHEALKRTGQQVKDQVEKIQDDMAQLREEMDELKAFLDMYKGQANHETDKANEAARRLSKKVNEAHDMMERIPSDKLEMLKIISILENQYDPKI